MSGMYSPHSRAASPGSDFNDRHEAELLSSPPSSAGSSQTVSTNDEDARRCEEWDLFAESEQGSRPSTEQVFRVYTPAIVSGNQLDDGSDDSHESEGDDADGSEGQEDHSGEDDSDSPQKIMDPAMITSPCDYGDCDAPTDGLDSSCSARASVETTTHTPDTTADASTTQLPSESLPLSARSALSTPVSTRANRLIPIANPTKIQVYVRIRPPSQGEQDVDAIISDEEANSLCIQSTQVGSVSESVVDRVFTDRSTQEDVYTAVDPGVRAALEGMNATIFAYGQTGTGKTFTMFGDDIDAPLSDMVQSDGETSRIPSGWGLIPRTIWSLCSESYSVDRSNSRIQLSCSFMQIYNDRVFDLLTDRKRQKPLVLREQPTIDGGTSVFLQGLSSEPVSTFSEAIQLVRRGRANRSVRETELNASSSRSHAIVQINLSIETLLPSGNKRTRTSRLNLVDLAGSEKWNTDVEMEEHHAAELKNINTSLSALGNCIAALAETGRRHIPYRDSTLTRLLQDSFGGNALAFLIATVSPSQKASEETIRTLQFADRARSVMQIVRVNESFSGSSELLAAKAQIKSLRERLSNEQRRRHETRLKEHEALQRDFAAKLQEKEDELKRVQRDNEVFARWREEDVKRIRALEARIKELDNAGSGKSEEVSWPPINTSSSRTEPVTSALKSNQSTEDAPEKLPQHFDPEHHGKSLARKKSNRATKNQLAHSNTSHLTNERLTNERGQKAKVRSYRSLIDKYSHSNKETSAEARNETPKTQAASTSTPSKTPAEQHDHMYSSTNLLSPQKRFQLPRSTSDTVFSPTAPTNAVSASDKTTSEILNGLHGSSASVMTESKRVYNAPSHNGSLWKAESLPSLVKSDLAQSTTSYQYQPAYPAGLAAPRDHIATQAWQLPPVTSTSPFDSPPFTRIEPTSIATAQSVCAIHSLKGCVLCAANDPQSTASLSSMPLSFKSSPSLLLHSSMTSSPLPAFADTRQPCERHQLPGCFICMKTTGDSSWRPVASSTLALAVPSSTSGASFPPMESLPVNRPPHDAKCPIHLLSNCVLCAGTNHSNLESRSQPAQPPSLDSFSSPIKRVVQPEATTWRINQLSEPGDPLAKAPTTSLSTTGYRSQDLARTQAPLHSNGQASSPSISMNRFTNDNGNRKQFDALVREASDAASIVLRRRA